MIIDKETGVSRKKLSIVGGLIAIFTIFGGYTAISIGQWQKLRSDTDRSLSGLRQDAKSLFADSTNSRERYIIIDRLANAAPGGDDCNVGWWGNWQGALFTGAKEIKSTCKSTRSQQVMIRRQAEKTVRFLDDQTTLQTALVKLSLGKTTVTEADFAKHAKVVSAVDKELKEMSVHEESRLLLEKAQEVVEKIDNAWTRVQKTDKAEDRKQYEATIDALDQAYHELGAVSKQATTSYTALLTDLEETLPQ